MTNREERKPIYEDHPFDNAYARGWNAAIDGKTLADNPYAESQSPEYELWRDGWKDSTHGDDSDYRSSNPDLR